MAREPHIPVYVYRGQRPWGGVTENSDSGVKLTWVQILDPLFLLAVLFQESIISLSCNFFTFKIGIILIVSTSWDYCEDLSPELVFSTGSEA